MNACYVRAASKIDKLANSASALTLAWQTPPSENPLPGRSHRCDGRWCLEASTFKGIGKALAEEGQSLRFGKPGATPPDGKRGA